MQTDTAILTPLATNPSPQFTVTEMRADAYMECHRHRGYEVWDGTELLARAGCPKEAWEAALEEVLAQQERDRIGTWIPTRSGKVFDYLHTTPDMVCIEDIASGLSNECRYAGQGLVNINVADHSRWVSDALPPHLALEGLMHDAAEAYAKDMPSPFKIMLPDYRRHLNRIDAVIRAKFFLPAKETPEVKAADLAILATERVQLLPKHPATWGVLEGISRLNTKLVPSASHEEARVRFLERYFQLTTQSA